MKVFVNGVWIDDKEKVALLPADAIKSYNYKEIDIPEYEQGVYTISGIDFSEDFLKEKLLNEFPKPSINTFFHDFMKNNDERNQHKIIPMSETLALFQSKFFFIKRNNSFQQVWTSKQQFRQHKIDKAVGKLEQINNFIENFKKYCKENDINIDDL